MASVGYGRVSTLDQDLTVQIEQLEAAGCEKVFVEKRSGAAADDRQALKDVLDWIREGDVLIVCRLDRLGRSMLDLLNILQQVQAKGAAFRCLNQGGLDTTTAEGRLMFGMLAAFAEFELHIRKERQAEGIEKAKALGKYSKKRKPKVDVDELVRLLKAGWCTGAIAKKLKVNRVTVMRHTPEELKTPQPEQLAGAQAARRLKRQEELRA